MKPLRNVALDAIDDLIYEYEFAEPANEKADICPFCKINKWETLRRKSKKSITECKYCPYIIIHKLHCSYLNYLDYLERIDTVKYPLNCELRLKRIKDLKELREIVKRVQINISR